MKRKSQKPVVKFVLKNYRSKLKAKRYKGLSIVRGKEWYIQYYYSDPDNPSIFKPVRTRGGLNRIKDLDDREMEAQILMRQIRSELERGLFPEWVAQKKSNDIMYEIEKKIESAETWPLHKAIHEYRKFISKHGYAPRTLQTYKGYIDDLDEWITEAGLTSFIASEFTEYDLLPLLDEAAETNEWSGRTYNNYLEFYGSFFHRCNKLEKVKNRGVRYKFDKDGIDLKITTPQVNKAYPPLIAKKIKEKLDLKGNELLRDYIEWIYLSLMRPKEMRDLRIENIDVESRHIRIVGKTGDRLIPISDQLLNLITKKKLMDMDGKMYVFGEGLRISLKQGSKNFPLEKYGEIKRALKLDDVYKIYSWKPTGVINMINAGFADKEIMTLTGHKTQDAFEKYKRDLVIDNSHAMKGDVIEF